VVKPTGAHALWLHTCSPSSPQPTALTLIQTLAPRPSPTRATGTRRSTPQ
jgi:hypothetical protein